MQPVICHISTVHHDDDVRIFYRECMSLAANGYEVHLVITAENDCKKNNVHVHALKPVKSRLFRMIFMPWVVMAKALKTKAKIIHYHDPELIFVGFILRCFFTKAVIFDIHETFTRQVMSKAYLPKWCRKAVGYIYSFAESIFLVGQQIIVANAKSKEDYPDRAFLVQNYPVIVNDFQQENKQSNTIPSIVYIGALEEIRGVMLYLQLAKNLKNSGRQFTMILIGHYNPALGKKMNDYIEKHQLHDCVKIAGRIPWDQAMPIVSKATIGLCILLPEPNYTSCLATKILEYMMVGVPTLASDFELWRPYVDGVGSGRMVNPLDIDQITKVCSEMLDDPETLERMSRAGYEAIREKYNWNIEFKNLLKCYQKCLN
ncbi:MAG: glycosyltransferase [Phycisphaerae bacterium]|nr:glycosyltransferase [Phycisphaerae bacterium]